MRIAQLTAYIVQLNLRKEFKHASYSRRSSDNLIVECRLQDGTIGWGEGVPREYVTGETPAGALHQLQATDLAEQFQADCGDWNDVIGMCESYRPIVDVEDPRDRLANAHRCAVELSILDAYGRLFAAPLCDVTRHFAVAAEIHEETDRVQYSSAISSGGFRKELLSSLAMRVYGFHHCKVKVGMQSGDDPLRLKRIRRWVGPKMDLRVDANEAWKPEDVVARISELEGFNISCAEQPVRHADVQALAEAREKVRTPIMLDESLTSAVDAETAIRDRTCDLFNIRLSKCGGFLASLRLAKMAHVASLGYQLGCHPGESAILSAAGRHFVTSVRSIRYREGSADRHLLRDSIVDRDLTFGRGGWAPALREPGLGVNINRAKLQPLIKQTHRFEIT